MKIKKKKCFVITPIGDEDSVTRRQIDTLIDDIIEPVFKEFDYLTTVSHRMYEPTIMMESIFEEIRTADIIVVNVSNYLNSTGANPNVMYEMGISDALEKKVVIIAKKKSEIPSDISAKRRIEFANSKNGRKKLKVLLRKSIQSLIENDDGSKNTESSCASNLDRTNAKFITEKISLSDLDGLLTQYSIGSSKSREWDSFLSKCR